MSSTHIVISEQEIDPNSLGRYSILPLPDFAIAALRDHGFDYNQEYGASTGDKLDSKQNRGSLKLKDHIRCVSKHINHDGPILRPDSSK